jgi:hypothetical protein
MYSVNTLLCVTPSDSLYLNKKTLISLETFELIIFLGFLDTPILCSLVVSAFHGVLCHIGSDSGGSYLDLETSFCFELMPVSQR